ncbi:odorant receptor 33b-like isoform X1 [Ooceraea biroi]|nr:odorant receptor 33b isoform X1 [Ooceraea biroi]XP_026823829.1 odorant receptor 33b-like isoform X1 [Ooceraea biroi]
MQHAKMDSCKTWNKEMTREFFPYKRIMWPVGSWPVDSSKNFAKLRALFVTVTLALMVAYLSMEIGYHDGANLNLIIDHFTLITIGTLTIIKISIIRLHRDDLSKYMCNAASDWIYVAQRDHREVMLRYANLGRFVFFSQMCSSYIVIIPLIAESLLSFVTMSSLQNITLSMSVEEMRVIKLPHDMICPFNAQVACFGICIVQAVQLISLATGNCGSDVFLFGICMHLCGQLEILGLQLSRFHEGKGNDSWGKTKLVALIERHCLLLNLAKDIVDTLDIILSAQLIFQASLICIIGLQFIVSLAISDFFLVVRSILSFGILMIQLFLYTYVGEILSLRTQAISTAIYLSKWYDLPINITRDICFIMFRATYPVYIRVGKFYNMDLNTFKTILKASASYFSVLRIMFTQY